MLRLTPDAAARARRARRSSRSSTGSRCIPICARSTSCRRGRPRCARCRREQTRAQKRIASVGTSAAARARGAPARAREAGRAALHREGHHRLASQALRPLASLRVDDACDRPRQLGRQPRAFRRVAVRCPFGKPGGHRAGAVRRGRHAVPDAVLRHVPAPRRCDLAPRGGRRRRALDARRARATTSSREPRRAQAEQRALRPELDAGIGGSTREGQPQVPARPRRVRARAARLRARRPRSSPSSRRCGPRLLLYSATDGRRARAAAVGGRQPPHRGAARRPRRYRELLGQVELVLGELRKRVGQTFTLDELAAAYDGADDWARDALDDADPEAPPARPSPAPSPARPSTTTRAARATTARDGRLLVARRLRRRLRRRDRPRRGAARQPDAGPGRRRSSARSSRCRSRRPRATTVTVTTSKRHNAV